MGEFDIYTNQEVEQTILAKFLSNNDEINKYTDLKEEHFLFEENAKLFKKMVQANNEGKPFVFRTLAENEKEKQYISLLTKIITVGNVDKYVKTLIDDSDKYNALEKAKEILEKAKTDRSVDIFSELSEAATRDIIERYDSSNEAMLKRLQDKMNGKEDLGISTGILGLDDYINNFQNGRLYVIGARSGMGKSALMCSMVENIEKTKKVGIISLEMLASELKQRMACIRGMIPHWKIEKGKCSDVFEKYVSALCGIKNIIISDKGGLTRAQVISNIRQMVARGKCKIVFIDHLGLVQVSDKGNLAHEIGKTTALLKSLAKELNIPIVCLCQINRGVEKDSDKRPKMSDLRDSGRIEEDADCVILIYRDGYYATDSTKTEMAQYIIAKCRNGKRGVVDGEFKSEYMKFE